VVHYFTADQSLAGLKRQLPVGSRVAVKEPFFEDFPQGGAAVCCAHPGNLQVDISAGTATAPPPSEADLEALVSERQFSEALRLAELALAEKPNDQTAHCCRAEALAGLGRHSEAARALLQHGTQEAKDLSKKIFQRVRSFEGSVRPRLAAHCRCTWPPAIPL